MRKIYISVMVLITTMGLSAQDVFVDSLTYEGIIEQVIQSDTVSIYMPNDIITIIRHNDLYVVVSEVSEHYIGVFNAPDCFKFIYWVMEYPLPDGEKYSNYYYQEIVEDKIWR